MMVLLPLIPVTYPRDCGQGGLDVIATKLDTMGQCETCVVCRGGRMVCGIRVRDRYLADLDGLEVWTGTRTLVTLVDSWGDRDLHRGFFDAVGLFPDARGVEFA
jgi:hypothetical protein